ncbi:hypothetical protein [Bremerella alba]|uniref:hypothetical protein n=1 Tax=Bremerella alba TaxID=980252 RepID=UPI001A954771|nr:hypothetical protein [Bremerella alba]
MSNAVCYNGGVPYKLISETEMHEPRNDNAVFYLTQPHVRETTLYPAFRPTFQLELLDESLAAPRPIHPAA